MFSIGDKVNMIHNAFSLAFRGSFSYTRAAAMSSYLLASKPEYVPFKTFIWHMSRIALIMEHRPSFKTIRV